MSEAYNIQHNQPELAEAPKPVEQVRIHSLRSKLVLGEWAAEAACAEMDSDIFFPDEQRNSRINKELTAEAKQICSECPVREECLDYALENHREMLGGIFGGYTEKERKRLLGLRQRTRRTKP